MIALYRDHATSEQFHSELKTDLDFERLPSGKFDINDLVMAFAALAYNILRRMGQQALLGPDAPVCHKARRRFGQHCPGFKGFKAFSAVYGSA